METIEYNLLLILIDFRKEVFEWSNDQFVEIPKEFTKKVYREYFNHVGEVDDMNHYKWLDKYFPEFLNRLGINFNICCPGIISCHADKCYGYKDAWDAESIPFERGVAIYLLSYLNPYAETCVRSDISNWVVSNYNIFKTVFDEINESENDLEFDIFFYHSREEKDYSYSFAIDEDNPKGLMDVVSKFFKNSPEGAIKIQRGE